ncbi:MAG: SAM-dependent methyltransferase [Planktothrix sp.]
MHKPFETDYVPSNISDLSRYAYYCQGFYDQQDTDNFYQQVSGGEHVHIGIFKHNDENLEVAKKRSVEYMSSLIKFNSANQVLDLGSGYGGTARYLSKTFGCPVTCVNISLKQNQINRERNILQNLDDLIVVVDGTFEDLVFEDSSFNTVWSQDAIFHSDQPEKVFIESNRVLQENGDFIFSVVMLSEDVSQARAESLTKFYSLNLQTRNTYRQLAHKTGFSEFRYIDLSQNIATNYSRLLAKMQSLHTQDLQLWSVEFYTKMEKRLQNWIEAGENGFIHWGILHFKKT